MHSAVPTGDNDETPRPLNYQRLEKGIIEMKNYLGPTSTKSSRRVTLLWVVICCGSLIAAFIVGISGNLPGLLLCYLAAISIILAFVHSWRRVKYFFILLSASLVGFFVFVVLHNVFYGLGQMAADTNILAQLLDFFHAIFFIIATLVCPAGFLIGVVGSVVTIIAYFKKKQVRNKNA